MHDVRRDVDRRGLRGPGGHRPLAGLGHLRTPALAPTTLKIADGEFVALVGPSGCGKSTILKLGCG